MTEAEYNLRCDEIRFKIAPFLISPTEEERATSAFKAAINALRYARQDALGLNKVVASVDAQPPHVAAMTGAIGTLQSLRIEVANLIHKTEKLSELLEKWPDDPIEGAKHEEPV